MQQTQPPPQGAADAPQPVAPHGFLRRPEPRSLGDAARRRLILSGVLPLAIGRLEGDPLAATPETEADAAMLHGFGWLDDLAAVASPEARAMAQDRVLAWVRTPPDPAATASAWRPDIAARRLLRWVFHGGTLLPGLDRSASAPVFAAMHKHLEYLHLHAASATAGLPRIEAQAGRAIAAMSLRGAEGQARAALDALAEAAASLPALQDRNPEALLDATALLVWTQEVAAETATPLPDGIAQAIDATAPVLRALRHADGSLPRMHGGGPGAPGRLDHVLRAAQGAALAAPGLALGYARMARSRATLIFDAAPPPASPQAQACALGMEFTIARTPLIVACGSAAGFGPVWAAAARATACASTATVDGLSSARIDGGAMQAPRTVWAGGCGHDGKVTPPDCGPEHGGETAHLLAGHDGWRTSHGLTHLRELWLEPDGLSLRGEDSLAAVDRAGRDRLSRIHGHDAMAVALHFHLHPALGVGMAEDDVALSLPDGEVWRFRHDGTATLTLEPSVYFDPAVADPLPAWQIVLTAPMGGFARQIGWSLGRDGQGWTFARPRAS